MYVYFINFDIKVATRNERQLENYNFPRGLTVVFRKQHFNNLNMKKFLLPHSPKNNPEQWLRIKQRIEGLLSTVTCEEKLEDFVLEMITKNGVPEVIMRHYKYK